MTKAQTSLYWREWQAAKKALVVHQGLLPSEADRERHAIHRAELGRDKSSSAFTNRDLDLVLAAFRALSRPDDLQAQIDAADQPSIRLVHAIGRLGLPDDYLDSLAAQLYHGHRWRDLPVEKLEMLRMTAKSRVSGQRHHLEDEARMASVS